MLTCCVLRVFAVRALLQDPHPHAELKPAPKIGNNILDFIGNTPLVRLNSIPASEGIECEMLAKCEYFNAGGSVKDRIGKRMILDAEASGRIKKGDVLIEPTSGQTRTNNERQYAGTWSRGREKSWRKNAKTDCPWFSSVVMCD